MKIIRTSKGAHENCATLVLELNQINLVRQFKNKYNLTSNGGALDWYTISGIGCGKMGIQVCRFDSFKKNKELFDLS